MPDSTMLPPSRCAARAAGKQLERFASMLRHTSAGVLGNPSGAECGDHAIRLALARLAAILPQRRRRLR
jgi:hypothetical protein